MTAPKLPRYGTERFRLFVEFHQPLKGCPFCGSDGFIQIQKKRDVYAAYVECIQCSATGPDFIYEDPHQPVIDAAEEWDNRYEEKQVSTPAL